MPPVDFFLTFDPSKQYMDLIEQFERDRQHATAEGRNLTNKEWNRHWKLMEQEWGMTCPPRLPHS